MNLFLAAETVKVVQFLGSEMVQWCLLQKSSKNSHNSCLEPNIIKNSVRNLQDSSRGIFSERLLLFYPNNVTNDCSLLKTLSNNNLRLAKNNTTQHFKSINIVC